MAALQSVSRRVNLLDGEFDPTQSPDTQILLPSGIGVLGIESWVQKLAEMV